MNGNSTAKTISGWVSSRNKELKRKSVNWKVWGATFRREHGGKGCWDPLGRGQERRPGESSQQLQGQEAQTGLFRPWSQVTDTRVYTAEMRSWERPPLLVKARVGDESQQYSASAVCQALFGNVLYHLVSLHSIPLRQMPLPLSSTGEETGHGQIKKLAQGHRLGKGQRQKAKPTWLPSSPSSLDPMGSILWGSLSNKPAFLWAWDF